MARDQTLDRPRGKLGACGCAFVFVFDSLRALSKPRFANPQKWNRSTNLETTHVDRLTYLLRTPKRKSPPVKLVLEMVEPLITSYDAYVKKVSVDTTRKLQIVSKETFAFLKTRTCFIGHQFFVCNGKGNKRREDGVETNAQMCVILILQHKLKINSERSPHEHIFVEDPRFAR